MDKEELLKTLEGWKEFRKSKNHELQYYQLAEVIQLVEQLDEPQKVKVPAFVAEWIEICIEKADLSSCLNGYYEINDGTIVRPRGFSEEFYDWLSDYDHMHDLARAYLDGYEVEEEPKYYVKFPKIGNDGGFYLRKEGGKFYSSSEFLALNDENCMLTEKEIKAIDERYWSFAVPVEKV
ncbi:DUF1642 domain-containing protein [Enterococcus sp. DIV0800]|uniref:DUF1642 domain-containing protein n=1 Tax=unclassified Enterococcus TaxID=2608891 RepID=UPI003D2FAD6D